jgi:hypothetical protein
MSEKISISKIILNPLPETSSGELCEKIYCKCNFCEKSCEVFTDHSSSINKLSGEGNFYCSFCLRHNFHTKNNKNVLILSFRSIVAQYYYQHYLNQGAIYISEIEDFIESHQKAGLVNPCFSYDPETMLWFIDFAKVGNTKKKIPIEEIYKTVLSILLSFNLSEVSRGVSLSSMYIKYKDAIELFYTHRRRPENKKMLIPTLGVNLSQTKNFERIRNFILKDLNKKT